MSIEIGSVETFPGVEPDKAQALKVIEEAAEVYGAWQTWDEGGTSALDYDERRSYEMCPEYRALLDECADVIQAVSNLLAAFGVRDFSLVMERCRERNERRGRLSESDGEPCAETNEQQRRIAELGIEVNQ